MPLPCLFGYVTQQVHRGPTVPGLSHRHHHHHMMTFDVARMQLNGVRAWLLYHATKHGHHVAGVVAGV